MDCGSLFEVRPTRFSEVESEKEKGWFLAAAAGRMDAPSTEMGTLVLEGIFSIRTEVRFWPC